MSEGSVADRIRELRDRTGLSAREVARLADLTPIHVSNIERIADGKLGRTAAHTLVQIARVFGVTLDWLVVGQGHVPRALALRDAVARARRRRLMAHNERKASLGHGATGTGGGS